MAKDARIVAAVEIDADRNRGDAPHLVQLSSFSNRRATPDVIIATYRFLLRFHDEALGAVNAPEAKPIYEQGSYRRLLIPYWRAKGRWSALPFVIGEEPFDAMMATLHAFQYPYRARRPRRR